MSGNQFDEKKTHLNPEELSRVLIALGVVGYNANAKATINNPLSLETKLLPSGIEDVPVGGEIQFSRVEGITSLMGISPTLLKKVTSFAGSPLYQSILPYIPAIMQELPEFVDKAGQVSAQVMNYMGQHPLASAGIGLAVIYGLGFSLIPIFDKGSASTSSGNSGGTKYTRREFIKMAAEAVTFIAISSLLSSCGIRPDALDQGFGNSGYVDPDLVYDPLEKARTLSEEYVQANVALIYASAKRQMMAGEPVVPGQYNPAMFEGLAELDRVKRLEKKISDFLYDAVEAGEITPPNDGFGAFFSRHISKANDIYRQEVETYLPVIAKMAGRMLISLTPADIIFDALDVSLGETTGYDVMGFPVTPLDKVINAGSLGISALTAGTSNAVPIVDAPDDINDAMRGFRYLNRIAQDGTPEIYIGRITGGNSIEYVRFGTAGDQLTETIISTADMRQIINQTMDQARQSGKLILDLGTGERVAKIGAAGELFKDGGYSVLCIEASSTAWKNVTSNITEADLFITNLPNGTKVVGYEGKALNLYDLVINSGASALRMNFPSSGLMGLALNGDQIAQVLNNGKKVQMTLNLTPLVKTISFGIAPDDLITKLYHMEGMADYINAAARATEGSADAVKYPVRYYEAGADIATQRDIMSKFVSATSRHKIPGDLENPLRHFFYEFLNHNTGGGSTVGAIESYFHSMLDGKAAPSYKLVRTLSDTERINLNTFFSTLHESGSDLNLPALLVEYAP